MTAMSSFYLSAKILFSFIQSLIQKFSNQTFIHIQVKPRIEVTTTGSGYSEPALIQKAFNKAPKIW